MNSKEKYIEDALYLMSFATDDGKPTTFYDEEDNCVHTIEDGVLRISTDFADYTSYNISKEGDGLTVNVRRRENYKNPTAKIVVLDLDDDDKEDQIEQLPRLRHPAHHGNCR